MSINYNQSYSITLGDGDILSITNFQASGSGPEGSPFNTSLSATFSLSGPTVSPVPEPSSLILLTIGGVAGLGLRAWRKSRALSAN